MKKIISYVSYITIFISLIIFLLTYFSQTYNLSLLFCIIFNIIISILIYFTGILINSKKCYNRNIWLYMIAYFSLLCSVTIFLNRSGFGLINLERIDYYLNTINLIPLKTIINYVFGKSSFTVIVSNILGNLIMLVPFSILLIVKNKKYLIIKNQFFILLLIIFFVEFFQFLFSVGRFDIDDFILNLGGPILLLLLIKKIKLSDFIFKFFNSDFNISIKLKYIFTICFIILVCVIDTIIFVEYIDNSKYSHSNNQVFFVVDSEVCKKIDYENYENYIIHLGCVDIYYNNDDGIQMSLIEAFEKKYISIYDIINRMNLNNTYENIPAKVYFNAEENMSLIICDSKNIYIDKYNLEINQNICN